jgi:hypothetical protein
MDLEDLLDYAPSSVTSSLRGLMAIPTILLIVFVLSLIAAIILLVVFLPKRNEYRYTGFAKKLYDFLNFNTFWISPIIKLMYMIMAFTLVLGGFIILFIMPLMGLAFMISGILIRLLFETGYILYSIFDQLRQINLKMGPGKEDAAPPVAHSCPKCGKAREASENFCQLCGYKY